jgi:hypothetical protein
MSEVDANNQSEEIVAKYKRLLSLARNSLEANQASLALKDKQINDLNKALDDEKMQKFHKNQDGDKETPNNYPKGFLRRIDVDNRIWILAEYDFENCWIFFANEQVLDDFIQRSPGIPIIKPNRCLSVEESVKIVSWMSVHFYDSYYITYEI